MNTERESSATVRLERLKERISPDFSGRQAAADELLEDLSAACRKAGFLAEWHAEQLTVLIPGAPRLWVHHSCAPLLGWHVTLENDRRHLVPPLDYDPRQGKWIASSARHGSALDALVFSLETLVDAFWKDQGKRR